jgi:hypothetical protein
VRVNDIYYYNGSAEADIGNVYVCTLGGDAATALWVYDTNIRGEQGITGRGVPAGGTVGQALIKSGLPDYVTGWADALLVASQTLTNAQKATQRSKFGIKEVIWSGILSEGGTITDAAVVAKLNNYSAYLMNYGAAIVGLCVRDGQTIYGGGVFFDNVLPLRLLGFKATLTSSVFTMVSAKITTGNDLATAVANGALSVIIGLA